MFYAHKIFILLDISSWLCWYLIRVFLNVRSFSIQYIKEIHVEH